MNLSDFDRVRRWRRAMQGSVMVLGAAGWLATSAPVMAQAPAADQQTVRTWCSGCHTESSPGHFQRLSVIRKSPEGWQMTIFRMQHVQHLTLPDDARDAIIKYLSDTQGLAPSESAAGRFALERRPNVQDLKLGDDLPVLCGRCHSLARIALQRRDADEWLKHMHMHVGQFPSLEYQASARDLHWWEIATKQLPTKLGAMFPFESIEWRAWKDRPHADLSGEWLVHGHTPGHGDFVGTLSVHGTGGDDYTAHYALQDAAGKPIEEFDSRVRVYTGYEWRGSSTSAGSQETREVLALSEDGRRLSGRWFEAAHSEVGGDVFAERAEGPAALFMVSPRALKAGATTEVLIAGRGLKGPVSFGSGTSVKVLKASPTLIRVAVKVNDKAAPGARKVTVGRTAAEMAAVYDRVDRLEVLPGYGIARIGGGHIAPVTAQFEALGFLDARDGQAPVALGPMNVSWKLEPHDENAVKAEDVKFAGTIGAGGQFTPAGGGPNPERKFGANNAGDLNVVASLDQDGRQLHGTAHLVVTVQRWNNPPIY